MSDGLMSDGEMSDGEMSEGQLDAGRMGAGAVGEKPAHARPSRPVLVTRPAGRGDSLVSLLEQQGIVAEHRPLTHLVPVTGPEVDLACEQLTAGEYTHLVLTSRTAVEALSSVGSSSGSASGSPVGSSAGSPAVPPATSPVGVPSRTQVVVVGEGTAAALAAIGIRADVVASGSGAALVAEMPTVSTAPAPRVLFPASAAASPTVPEGLRAKGYRVDQVTVYRPEPVDLPEVAAQALRIGGYSAIVLTSPMIARRAAAIGIHPSTAILTIGEPTTEAVREAGLEVALQAEEPTDAALASAVVQALDLGP